VVARVYCRQLGLTGGHADRRLAKRLLRYGASQLLARTPTAVNVNIDQLVLSQAVRSFDLGQYSLAVTLTSLATPALAPIGSVLFPRLASRRDSANDARRMQWAAVLVTVAVSTALMAALAATASSLIPLVFGNRYTPSVDLVWIMAPSGIFLALNQVVGDLLRGRGQPLAIALSQGVGAVLTLAMLALLVPALGVTGAAITTTVTYGVTTLGMFLAFLKPRAASGPSHGV
jgi:O-antigen/teichoic acid export membrane protein